MSYGITEPGYGNSPADIVGDLRTAPKGNVIVVAGTMNTPHPGNRFSRFDPEAGWHKTGHIVMKPEEAARFAEDVLALTEKDGEKIVYLNLTEYETSILQGALETFKAEHEGGNYDADAGTALDLLQRVNDQLDDDWKSKD